MTVAAVLNQSRDQYGVYQLYLHAESRFYLFIFMITPARMKVLPTFVITPWSGAVMEALFGRHVVTMTGRR